jgi:hypothetical protein
MVISMPTTGSYTFRSQTVLIRIGWMMINEPNSKMIANPISPMGFSAKSATLVLTARHKSLRRTFHIGISTVRGLVDKVEGLVVSATFFILSQV